MKRLVTSSRWLSALALCALCACAPKSQGANTAPPLTDRESAQIAPTVEHYKKDGTLTGFDIKGDSLLVFADSEKYSQLDDQVEEDMKASLLRVWAATWTANHAHSHATLHVVLQNYYGQEMATLTKRV